MNSFIFGRGHVSQNKFQGLLFLSEYLIKSWQKGHKLWIILTSLMDPIAAIISIIVLLIIKMKGERRDVIQRNYWNRISNCLITKLSQFNCTKLLTKPQQKPFSDDSILPFLLFSFLQFLWIQTSATQCKCTIYRIYRYRFQIHLKIPWYFLTFLIHI